MKCNDEDLLRFLEGTAGEEAKIHIATCTECSAAARELSVYRKVFPCYREGKRLLESLDEHMKSFDEKKVRHLPPGIEEMLREAGGEGAGDRKIRPLERPARKTGSAPGESAAAPMAYAAVPRDITRPKKGKSKKEGADEPEK